MADSTAYLPIHTRFMIGGKTELLPKNSRQPFEIMVGYDGYIGKSYVAGSIGAGLKNFSDEDGWKFPNTEVFLAADRKTVNLQDAMVTAVRELEKKDSLTYGDVIHLEGFGEILAKDCNLDYIALVYPSFLLPLYIPVKVVDVFTAWAWLVPVSEPEADYIRKNGWDEFWNFTGHEDCDLLNISRDSVI